MSDSQSEKIAGDPGHANAVRHVLGSTDLLAGIAGKLVVGKTTVITSSHQITRLQITLIVPGQRTRGQSYRLPSPAREVLPLLIRLTISEKKPNRSTTARGACRAR
jgi:hypothetical protein